MSGRPFSLGVNYWPRAKAMRMWSEFERTVVAEDFALISSLGMSTVRLFLLWEDFQPEPTSVSERALQSFGTVCDLATSNDLSLNVTFFTGHMSGPSWIPSWMLSEERHSGVRQVVSGGRVVDSGYKNPYVDPEVIVAEELLLNRVVTRFREHPAIGIWNLGNEPDLVAHPPTSAAGREWTRRMVAAIKETGATQPVGMGLHTESLLDNVGFRVDQVFREVDVAAMHAYPMYQSWARTPLDPDLVPFSCALTSALCGKPTLMEEFGGCTSSPESPSRQWSFSSYGSPRTQFMANETELADYFDAVLPKLQEVGATGALLWCFADYVPELWQRPPCDEAQHERFFGLVRADGSIKPHADTIATFAHTEPQIRTATRTVTLDVTPDEYYAAPREHLIRLYAAYTAGK